MSQNPGGPPEPSALWAVGGGGIAGGGGGAGCGAELLAAAMLPVGFRDDGGGTADGIALLAAASLPLGFLFQRLSRLVVGCSVLPAAWCPALPASSVLVSCHHGFPMPGGPHLKAAASAPMPIRSVTSVNALAQGSVPLVQPSRSMVKELMNDRIPCTSSAQTTLFSVSSKP